VGRSGEIRLRTRAKFSNCPDFSTEPAPFDKFRACPERSRMGQALSAAEWARNDVANSALQ